MSSLHSHRCPSSEHRRRKRLSTLWGSAVQPSLLGATTGGNSAYTQAKWMCCEVLEFDAANRRYLIEWELPPSSSSFSAKESDVHARTKQRKHVKRLQLVFKGESVELYWRRVCEASLPVAPSAHSYTPFAIPTSLALCP